MTDLRRPTADDADAVLAVMVARDIVDLGEPDIELADVLADWALPDVDLARDAWVAEDDSGTVVGYGLVLRDDALIYVHPDAEGRGIGTALREACEARAAEKEVAVLRQFLPVGNETGRALVLDAGYWPVQHYSRLRIPLYDAPAPPEAALRAFDRERDEESVHALIQEAFSEIEGSVQQPLESWRVTTIEKEGWDPSLWLLLEDAEGLAGAVLGERWDVNEIGYVAQLGVARRARGRGYGRALLLGAFDAFRRAGLKEAEVSVNGANAGALRLYESVGMRPVWHAERWEKPLGHG